MERKVTIITVFILFCVTFLSGQQAVKDDRILFRGVILSASSGERLAGSKVFINRSLYGLAREDGTFSFYASRHDTIVFDMMGFKPSSLIVRDSLRANEFLTGIYLQSDTIEIGEVVIIPNLEELKAEMMNPEREADQKMENARNNLNMAAYQGRVSEGKLGDPQLNYDVLRQRQRINAYEKGGIPSDRMVSLSPLLLIPAAYLLIKGPPEKPLPPSQGISAKELDDLNNRYKAFLKKDKR